MVMGISPPWSSSGIGVFPEFGLFLLADDESVRCLWLAGRWARLAVEALGFGEFRADGSDGDEGWSMGVEECGNSGERRGYR